LAYWQGIGRDVIRLAMNKWVLLRSAFITTTFLAFYGSIPFLSLSTVGAANYIAPIFVTLLSAYVISEPVGKRGWFAVFIGFSGMLILLQPGTDAFSPLVIVPVIGAGFYALSHITVRTKCHSVPLPAMAFALNFTMFMAGVIGRVILFIWQPNGDIVNDYPYLLGGWSPIGTTEWLILGALAVFTIVIGLGLAGAYQAGPPATIATFEYSYLVFVAIWDLLFFNLAPSITTLTGMVLIIIAGLMVMRRKTS
jgi:drug/metabolite transporter (DMT)-like permease